MTTRGTRRAGTQGKAAAPEFSGACYESRIRLFDDEREDPDDGGPEGGPREAVETGGSSLGP